MIKRLLIAGLLLSTLTFSSARAGQYFQDFSNSNIGATNFSDGSKLFSSSYAVAHVANDPYYELQLTAMGSSLVNSAYELPDKDPGTPIYAFSAKWNTAVYGDFPNAADGFSFNFGQLSSLNLAATNGFQETGYGVGLSFGVQTYSGNSPGFYIRVGTNVVRTVPYPVSRWGVNSGMRHFFEVDWNYYTGMSVRMDGTNLFSNVAVTNFIPRAGDRFVFGARCGGLSEYILLDNIAVITGGNLVQLPASGPYYANDDAGGSRTNAFDGNASTSWATSASLPAYVGATFFPVNPVAFFAVTSANKPSRSSDPVTFTLEGSDRYGTVWAFVTAGSAAFQNPMETHCLLGDIDDYEYSYRLNVTATQISGSGCSLGELRLYSFSEVLPPYSDFIQRLSAGFTGVTASSDGTRLWACANNNGIWSSTNFGLAWTQSSAPVALRWQAIASDAAADTIYAVTPTSIYRSSNFGATWTMLSSNSFAVYEAVACSSNGVHAVVAGGGHMLRSDNSGGTWHILPNSPNDQSALGMSADGSLLLSGASTPNSRLSRSYDGGTNWAFAGFETGVWRSIWFNWQNGDIFTATTPNAGDTFGVFKSTDNGTGWYQTSSRAWNSYTMTVDENFSAAVSVGNLYTWSPLNGATPPPPTFQSYFNNDGTIEFEWPKSIGGNFVLQESTDLKNWTNSIWPLFGPFDDITVTVPTTFSKGFYRLKSQ